METPRKEAEQFFNKGINKDIGKQVFQDGYYLHMENGSIITSDGLTTGNPSNIKGNKLFYTLPNISNVYKITSDFPPGDVVDINITINGFTYQFTYPSYSTKTDFFERLKAWLESTFFTIPLVITYNTDYLLVYVLNATLTISYTSTYSTLTRILKNSTGLFPIGWCLLRDDIYIFSTDSAAVNPSGTTGQIWKLTYDKATLANTISLIYNNILDFSVENPIANPGMIEGRYENLQVQKIYWTDDYNPPRVINVADPNAFAIPVENLTINSTVKHSIPLPEDIIQNNGALETGVYQLAYRLKNSTSGETTISPLSNEVHIKRPSETSTSFIDDTGSDINVISGKAIKFKIQDLDTSYDRIEYILVKREVLGTPEITIIGDEIVPNSGIVHFTVTGNETNILALTTQELNKLNTIFNTVGTICSKKNYLLFGDVKTKNFDINYDARAFRYKHNSKWANPVVPETYPHGISQDILDDINPSNIGPVTEDSYLFKDDGYTFGGRGANISYTFVQERISLDDHFPTASTASAPYRTSTRKTLTNSLNVQNQSYPLNNSFDNFLSPYIVSLKTGYTRGEMYRFSIVFYDVYGNTSFAKWIADIRMPDIYMPDPTNISTKKLLFPTAEYTTNNLDGFTLGINFSVSIPQNLLSIISGFSIVRVQRASNNRTILGQGLLHPTHFGNNGSGFVNLIPDDTLVQSTAIEDIDPNFMTIQSPEFLFDSAPSFQTGDTLEVVGLLENIWNKDLVHKDGSTAGGGEQVVSKNYQFRSGNQISPIFNSGNNPYVLSETKEIDNWHINDSSYTVNSINIRNRNESGRSAGGKTLLLRGSFSDFANNGGGDFYSTDAVEGTRHTYLANYKRNLGSSQYGGNTLSQRSNNVYISCNHFQPVNQSSPTQYNFNVFGGDTFVTVFDNLKQFGNWMPDAPGGTKWYWGTLSPVESTINTELRQVYPPFEDGTSSDRIVFNKESINVSTSGGSGLDVSEVFKYNKVYSAENDNKYFVPKPIPFISNEEFDTRVYRSQPKINGELTDSWTIFKQDDYIDLDSKYGKLTILVTNNNELLFFQPDAFGTIELDSQQLLQSPDGSTLTVGSSGILTRFDYKSTGIGSIHKFGFGQSDSAVSWFDAQNRRFYKYNGQINPLEGISSWINKNLTTDLIKGDNPFKMAGITCTYDYKFKQFLYTIFPNSPDGSRDSSKSFTLSHNDLIDNWHSFYSFTPVMYINDKYHIISSEYRANSGWIHDEGIYGTFYNRPYKFNFQFITNPEPNIEKIFDNFELETTVFLPSNQFPEFTENKELTFDSFRVFNDYQNTNEVPLIVDKNLRRQKRTWNIAIGSDRVIDNTKNIFDKANLLFYPNRPKLTKRIKSNYIITDFWYNVNSNYSISLQLVKTFYRNNTR